MVFYCGKFSYGKFFLSGLSKNNENNTLKIFQKRVRNKEDPTHKSPVTPNQCSLRKAIEVYH